MSNRLVLPADDMEIGQFVAVLRYKLRNIPLALAGQSLQITAIRLPFVIAAVLARPPMTVPIDLRFFDLTRLPEEYVAAQLGPRGNHPPIS